MQGAGSSCGARRVAHGGPGDGAPGCSQAARRQGALQASPAGPAPGVPASPGGAVLRAWGPATPGRCGQCTDPRRVSPFCSHSPSTPRRPRPSSHAAHRPRRPSRSLRAEFRVCGTAGLPLTRPGKPPTDATPPPSFRETLSPERVAPRPEGWERSEGASPHAYPALPRGWEPFLPPRGASQGRAPAARALPSRQAPKPPRVRARPARSRLATPGPPNPPRARARSPRAHVTLPSASPERAAAPARRSSCSPR